MTQPVTSREKWFNHRTDLTGEHHFGDLGQALAFIIFMTVWIADIFFLQWTSPANHLLPGWVRLLIGAGILFLAGYLARSGLTIVFSEVRETPAVIRKGIFRFLRHPIYFSEVLIYSGSLVLGFSWAALVIAAGATSFLYFLSRYEEKLLLNRFGDEYRKYMNDVGMWIPRLRR